MKILVLADSRGMWPRERNWPGMLAVRLGSQHQVYTYVSGVDCWLGDLHMMENHLLTKFPNEHFDLIIHQGGWHEGGPCFWVPEIWQSITNTPTRQYNPKALTREVLSQRDGKTKYLYIDRQCEEEIYNMFKSRSKRILSLGLGALRPPNDLEVEYKLGMEHHYTMLETNDVFLNRGHDQLNMPMDDHWINNNTGPDRIHYNAQGSDYVSEYIARYVKRLGTTLNDYFINSEKFSTIKDKVLRIGSFIAKHTEKGDVVLLAKEPGEELRNLFWGCLLYGRVPFVKQVLPSQVREIRDILNVKLAICDEKDGGNIGEFIPTKLSVEESEITDRPLVTVDDTAFVQITSEDKKCKVLTVSHKAAIEQCVEYGTKLGLDKDSKILSFITVCLNGGIVTSLLMPAVFDCEAKVLDTFVSDGSQVINLITNYKPTHVWLRHHQLRSVSKLPKESFEGVDFSSIKHIVDTENFSQLEDYKEFMLKMDGHGLGTDVLSCCFTSEENIFAVSQSDGIKLSTESKVSSGRNIPGVSILIMDESGVDISEYKQVGRVMFRSGTITTKETGLYGYVDTGKKGFMEEGELFII